eukprot:11790155-Karenia_brevis.AAC.1
MAGSSQGVSVKDPPIGGSTEQVQVRSDKDDAQGQLPQGTVDLNHTPVNVVSTTANHESSSNNATGPKLTNLESLLEEAQDKEEELLQER